MNMGSGFFRGMSLGMAAGAAIGSMMPRRRRHRTTAAKAVRTLSSVMDSLSDAMEE